MHWAPQWPPQRLSRVGMVRRDLPTSPRLASTRSSVETRVGGAKAESEPGRALSAGIARMNDPWGPGCQEPAGL
eukprot:12376605-Alexandrium_andersonii.AAC.1